MKKQILAMALGLSVLFVGCGQISNQKEDTNSSEVQKMYDELNKDNKEKEVIDVNMSANTAYDDGIRHFEFLGLKEYKQIKGDKYTDTPEKGKIYLALFMQVNIKSDDNHEGFYFNYNYLTTKVDGKEIKHTVIMNDPFGYDTLLKKYSFGQNAGYLVYEVPENWEKLTLNYKGLEQIAGNNINMIFTRKDLKDPEEKWKVIPE